MSMTDRYDLANPVLEQQTAFLLKWQAHVFQHTRKKPKVMVALLGPQRAAIGATIGVITDMMGKDQFINVQEVKAEKARDGCG